MYPEEQIIQEIVKAIGEIMDKYYLKMTVERHYLYDSDNEQVVSYMWNLKGSTYTINIDDILEQLLSHDYGKVKK